METVEDDLDEESQDEAPYTQSYTKAAYSSKVNSHSSLRGSHIVNLTSNEGSPDASHLQKSIEEVKYEYISSDSLSQSSSRDKQIE